MAPAEGIGPLSSKRAEFAGPPGIKGLLANGRAFSIALFASLGGLVYGYNQGMFSDIMTMHSFQAKTGSYTKKTGVQQAIITSIFELGAWLGTLLNGILADSIGRRATMVCAVVVFCAGVIVQANTESVAYMFGGRWTVGMGVGSLSMIVPLYNAELAPPEIRGSLVAVQQLAITFGIMVSFWIGYGCNFIGGTGKGQSQAAWLIPTCIQLIPALLLAFGMLLFMPQSPRHLMNKGREEECLQTLAKLRGKSTDDIIVRVEFLEIKAMRLFDIETSKSRYPNLQDGSWSSNAKITFYEYLTLVTNRSLFKRTVVACLIMTFQQWNGINAINYYAPFIFKDVGLHGSSTTLLATGVVGILEFVFTIPAVLWVDNIGRKKILIAGAIGMASCHFIIAALIGTYRHHWAAHMNAGWAAIAFIWIFIINFAYSWGPVAWIIVSEVFPLSMRAKGISIGGSSNWLNNFGVGMATSPFVSVSSYGTFIFFGCITTLAVFYVIFLVPETKDLTLEEMDEIFGSDGIGRQDLERKAQIERDIGLYALLGNDTASSQESDKGVGMDEVHDKSSHE